MARLCPPYDRYDRQIRLLRRCLVGTARSRICPPGEAEIARLCPPYDRYDRQIRLLRRRLVGMARSRICPPREAEIARLCPPYDLGRDDDPKRSHHVEVCLSRICS